MSDLGERKKRILKAIIDEYVEHAEPVGSKILVDRTNLGLSAATLRNEMSELESMGYLVQPHTSSGRIPSHLGYRIYVNELMKEHTLTDSEVNLLSLSINRRMHELDSLMADASRLISEMSNYAAVSLTPRISGDVIKKIDIFICEQNLFVFVMLSESGMVNDKLIRTISYIAKEAVNELARQLNEVICGISPADISFRHIAILENGAGNAKELLGLILDYIRTIMLDYSAVDVRVDGASKLLHYPEYSDVDKAREVFDFLDGMHDATWITQKIEEPDRESNNKLVDIRIGKENRVDQLKNSSFIVTDIALSGNSKIYIGLLGPTRMDYAKVSARLQFFSKILGKVIEDMMGDKNREV